MQYEFPRSDPALQLGFRDCLGYSLESSAAQRGIIVLNVTTGVVLRIQTPKHEAGGSPERVAVLADASPGSGRVSLRRLEGRA